MSETTKRDLARVEFLTACAEYFRAEDRFAHAGSDAREASNQTVELWNKMPLAWAKYRDLLDGTEKNETLDEHRWFCPHCGGQRTPFNFQLVAQVLMGVGAVQYFNVFCGVETCRKLLTVAMVGFVPEQQLIDQAHAQMRGKLQV